MPKRRRNRWREQGNSRKNARVEATSTRMTTCLTRKSAGLLRLIINLRTNLPTEAEPQAAFLIRTK